MKFLYQRTHVILGILRYDFPEGDKAEASIKFPTGKTTRAT